MQNIKKRLFKILLAFTIVIFNSCKESAKESTEIQKSELITKNLDSITNILEIVYVDDQNLRQEYQKIEKEFGWDSEQAKELWEKQDKFDSINLAKVTSIIDKFGWLGIDEIGQEGNSALFLVIQHSDLKNQLKYLPILEKATEQGKASKIDFAMLTDRVLMKQGKKQIYGSQLNWDAKTEEYYVASVIEPEKINERRESVGLESIEEYIGHWNLEWDLEKYKKRIERIENENK